MPRERPSETQTGRLSKNLFQIKGHVLARIYLLMLLKTLCEELNLGQNDFEPQTVKNLFTSECYVSSESGRMIVLVTPAELCSQR